MSRAIRTIAQAKVNLFLRVLAREDTGFHQLETLFCRLELGDEITLRLTTGTRSLECAGPAIPADGIGPVEQNLAWRAATAYSDATGRALGFSLEITKNIPVGGGLGGGSADAAAVLRLLNRVSPAPLTQLQLMQIGASLGADVPFLVSDFALALGWGRGERLLGLSPLPRRRCLLLVPPFGINTAEAYGWLSERGPRSPSAGSLALESLRSWTHVDTLSHNDFEAPVFDRHQALRDLAAAVAQATDGICRMSGSGSTLFAFPSARKPLSSAFAGALAVETHTATDVASVEEL